ncbi:MAG: SprT family zinc-dependent metalloprotease [Dyadobacter sp.]|uniref:M48 family metallopeptidase n=1 Tax=Dyadobacter sp. TaxID=1914288 RepID=UPI003263FCBD
MTDYIVFGSKRIDFELTFANRKSLGITVTPDLDVLVKAPDGTPIVDIKERLRKRAPWIIRQQSFFLSFHPKNPPRKFVSGETHLFLGRPYRLKIIASDTEAVKISGKFIEVFTADKSRTETLISEWYLDNARKKFHSIAQPLIKRFKKYEVEPSSIILRNMPTRWGSCTPRGKIILNPELIKAPKGCIEYVIVHELCHLVHHNHTQKFVDLQNREFRDWEKWKGRLERLLA